MTCVDTQTLMNVVGCTTVLNWVAVAKSIVVSWIVAVAVSVPAAVWVLLMISVDTQT